MLLGRLVLQLYINIHYCVIPNNFMFTFVSDNHMRESTELNVYVNNHLNYMIDFYV